jgi:hypothetical protein
MHWLFPRGRERMEGRRSRIGKISLLCAVSEGFGDLLQWFG